jgi:hypothetical protein
MDNFKDLIACIDKQMTITQQQAHDIGYLTAELRKRTTPAEQAIINSKLKTYKL